MKRTLVWFRNDLRIHDNKLLYEACKQGKVLPVYCFDPYHFKHTHFGFKKTGLYRTEFLRESVKDLRVNLRTLGADLIIRFGKPEEELSSLVQEQAIDQVFVQKEITKEETEVEQAVSTALNIPITYFWGSTLYHIDNLPFSKESIPDIFSTFRKSIEKKSEIRELVPSPGFIDFVDGVDPIL
ncbi:MAG: hypothetical protein BalsKO_23360 [Balneolaceae bacterium]